MEYDYLTTLVGYLHIKFPYDRVRLRGYHQVPLRITKFHYEMYHYRRQDREYLYRCRERLLPRRP